MLPTWWGSNLQPSDHQLDIHSTGDQEVKGPTNDQFLITISTTDKN